MGRHQFCNYDARRSSPSFLLWLLVLLSIWRFHLHRDIAVDYYELDFLDAASYPHRSTARARKDFVSVEEGQQRRQRQRSRRGTKRRRDRQHQRSADRMTLLVPPCPSCRQCSWPVKTTVDWSGAGSAGQLASQVILCPDKRDLFHLWLVVS